MMTVTYRQIDTRGRIYLPHEIMQATHLKKGDLVRIAESKGELNVSLAQVFDPKDAKLENLNGLVEASIKQMTSSDLVKAQQAIANRLSELSEGNTEVPDENETTSNA